VVEFEEALAHLFHIRVYDFVSVLDVERQAKGRDHHQDQADEEDDHRGARLEEVIAVFHRCEQHTPLPLDSLSEIEIR
jgi:hypothetical protein